MNELASDITRLLVRELDGFKRELALFSDEALLWRAVPGVTNSAGNLALHVAGGLQYLVGSVLGHTGYVRDREAEFARRDVPRDAVDAELDRAAWVVREVLSRLPEAAFNAPFPEPVLGVTFKTRLFLLHLCAHAAFHLGQAGYVRRALTGDNRSSAPVPLGPLSANVL
jgi:hypothetical protein